MEEGLLGGAGRLARLSRPARIEVLGEPIGRADGAELLKLGMRKLLAASHGLRGQDLTFLPRYGLPGVTDLSVLGKTWSLAQRNLVAGARGWVPRVTWCTTTGTTSGGGARGRHFTKSS